MLIIMIHIIERFGEKGLSRKLYLTFFSKLKNSDAPTWG